MSASGSLFHAACLRPQSSSRTRRDRANASGDGNVLDDSMEQLLEQLQAARGALRPSSVSGIRMLSRGMGDPTAAESTLGRGGGASSVDTTTDGPQQRINKENLADDGATPPPVPSLSFDNVRASDVAAMSRHVNVSHAPKASSRTADSPRYAPAPAPAPAKSVRAMRAAGSRSAPAASTTARVDVASDGGPSDDAVGAEATPADGAAAAAAAGVAAAAAAASAACHRAAMDCFRGGRYAEAIAHWDEAVEVNSTDANA